jgi:hypothetical protein
MSARQRARLSQQTAAESKTLDESSESEEETEDIRKPAFVFDDSDDDDDSEDDNDGKQVKDQTNENIDGEQPDDSDDDDKKDIDGIRERNSNFKKKKKNDVNPAAATNQKDCDYSEISMEEFSKLISSSDVGASSGLGEEKERAFSAGLSNEISTLLKVDVRGLDIDSIMKRRFGGMAVNEMPEGAGAGPAGGGAQRRRFAAAVAGAEKARVRIAKLSNKVS